MWPKNQNASNIRFSKGYYTSEKNIQNRHTGTAKKTETEILNTANLSKNIFSVCEHLTLNRLLL